MNEDDAKKAYSTPSVVMAKSTSPGQKAQKPLFAGTECDYEVDRARSCQRRAPCSSFRRVKPGFILTLDAARVLRAGAKCDVQMDNDVCVEVAPKHDTMGCGNEAVLRYDSSCFYCTEPLAATPRTRRSAASPEEGAARYQV